MSNVKKTTLALTSIEGHRGNQNKSFYLLGGKRTDCSLGPKKEYYIYKANKYCLFKLI